MRSPASRRPTKIASLSNSVVFVGGEGPLSVTAQHSALMASGANLVFASVSTVATVAAETRPYAIIVPRVVYEFGGDEFDALARDVDAELVVVPDEIRQPVLSTLLAEAAQRLG
ncbi:MAG TPA: hypothetical protein VL400_27170 [Polyangiaceae bacterium]|nr:hypothetical protein [Polyangiaceae bacterium]